MHPLEASRALKRVSVHIKMADGAGVPGVRMVADGARVRMDIVTNKEQSQDKDMSKGSPVNQKRSRPVVTGQWAAQRKNSPRQWGRPFGRAPREICPAISTHPHWGGDCTTTMRWQDAGADHSKIGQFQFAELRITKKMTTNFLCAYSMFNLADSMNRF